MKLGILVPAYNVERYVADCLDSILAQTFTDFEVFVLNDGSKDRTLEILREYEAKDKRIHVLTRENRGVTASLNELLDKIDDSIDLVTFIDADDFIHPKMYEILCSVLADHHADMAECGIIHVESDGSPKTTFADEMPEYGISVASDPSVFWLERTTPGRWINKQNKIYTKASIGTTRFRSDMSFEEDNFFAREINAKIKTKVMVSCALYAYRNNPTSATKEGNSLKWKKYVKSCAERVRLSMEVFVNAGRVPKRFEAEYRREVVRAFYRMVVRKNLKKNKDAVSRKTEFINASNRLNDLERDYGFRPIGLRVVPRLAYEATKRKWYRLAFVLAHLT